MPLTQLRRAWYGLDSGDLSAVAQNLTGSLETTARVPGWAIYAAPFEPYVRLAACLSGCHYGLAYYAMDDFTAAPALGYTQFSAVAEDYLVQHADALMAVTAHAAHSLERFGKQAAVIPNGVELAPFRNGVPPPAAPLERGELTLGFWGTLMDTMFDADLIAHVAGARPRWAIHLLGALDPEPHRPSLAARLKPFANIYFHGPVKHAELSRYAAAFDVCLAPLPDNAFTRGRDPLKVQEYLAAGKPVVVSYAAHLAGLPNVWVAQTPAAFVTAIEQAARTRVDRAGLDSYLAAQSWETRAEQLESVLRTVEPTAGVTGGAVLPGFVQPDVASVMRYAQALEGELAEVQDWAHVLERQAQTQRPLARVRGWLSRS
jgi:glycosyltransferase involved in cell wall biosynthesis